ncbi:hypothetical protein CerSpe_215020 [Prunus speciosa]
MPHIVFSDAWWIGTQAENPEEAQLDFPKELTKEFVGFKDNTQNMTLKVVQVEDNVSDDGNKDLMRATPIRHSARTAGKRFNFGNASSGDDSFESDTYLSEGEDEKIGGLDSLSGKHASGNILIFDSVKGAQIPKQNQESSVSEAKSKKQSHSTFAVTTSVEDSHRNHSSLIQAISTLFKKVEKKKVDSIMQSQVQLPSSKVHETPKNPKKPASPKVSGQKSRQTD